MWYPALYPKTEKGTELNAGEIQVKSKSMVMYQSLGFDKCARVI